MRIEHRYEIKEDVYVYNMTGISNNSRRSPLKGEFFKGTIKAITNNVLVNYSKMAPEVTTLYLIGSKQYPEIFISRKPFTEKQIILLREVSFVFRDIWKNYSEKEFNCTKIGSWESFYRNDELLEFCSKLKDLETRLSSTTIPTKFITEAKDRREFMNWDCLSRSSVYFVSASFGSGKDSTIMYIYKDEDKDDLQKLTYSAPLLEQATSQLRNRLSLFKYKDL